MPPANDVNTYEAEEEYLNNQNISLTTRSKGVEEQLRLEVLKDDILIEYNALLESITQNYLSLREFKKAYSWWLKCSKHNKRLGPIFNIGNLYYNGW